MDLHRHQNRPVRHRIGNRSRSNRHRLDEVEDDDFDCLDVAVSKAPQSLSLLFYKGLRS